MARKANGKTNGHQVQLARQGDPLVTVKGEVIPAEREGDDVSSPSVPLPSTAVAFKDYQPIVKRVISDLRSPPQAVNVAIVILGYTLLGISDGEVCSATNLTLEEVFKVRASRIYSEAFENIMRELINANSEFIECRVAAYSGMALGQVASIAAAGKRENNRLTASRDILDRAGHRPQDNAARQNSGMNELHIVITNSKDDVTTEIKLNPREEADHHA